MSGGMNVGTIYATLDGDSSRLVAANEKARASLGQTNRTLQVMQEKLGATAYAAGGMEKAGQRIATAGARGAAGMGQMTVAAERAASKLEQLRGAADRVDDKAGKLQVAVGGLSSAFGIAGSRISDAIGGIADSAMAFATGGPVMAGLLALGVVVAGVVGHFNDIDKAAATAASAATTKLSDLREEVKGLDRELRALQLGVDVGKLSAGEDLGGAITAANAQLSLFPGGRQRFDLLMESTKGDPAMLRGYGSHTALDRSQYVSPELFEKTKAAVALLDANVARLASIARAEAEQRKQALEDAVLDAQVDAANAKTLKEDAKRHAREAYQMAERHQDRTTAWTQQALRYQGGGVLSSSAFDQPGVAPFRPDISLMDDGASTRAEAVARGRVTALTNDEADELEQLIRAESDMHEATLDRTAALEAKTAALVNGAAGGIADVGVAMFTDGPGAALGGGARAGAAALGNMAGGPMVGEIAGAIVDSITNGINFAFDQAMESIGDDRLTSAIREAADAAAAGIQYAGAAFVLSLARQTESFQRFEGAMGVVADRLISALEPLFANSLWLVGLMDSLVSVVEPIFSALAESPEILFEAMKGFAIMLGNMALVLGGAMNMFSAVTGVTIDVAAIASALEDLKNSTLEQSQASGEASAEAAALKEAMEGVSTNLVSGYRTPLYAAEAPNGPGMISPKSFINIQSLTIINKQAQLDAAIDDALRARGRNQWRSGGEDDDTN